MAKEKITLSKIGEELFRRGRSLLESSGIKTPTQTDIKDILADSLERDKANFQYSKEGKLKDLEEIAASLLWYSTPSRAKKIGIKDTSDISYIADGVLKKFRMELTSHGYKGLAKQMIPIVQKWGSVHDLTALCLCYFDYERNENGKKPKVTRKRADLIKASIRAKGDSERNEFIGYLTEYDTYSSFYDEYTKVKAMYVANAKTVAINIINYDWGMKTIRFFNGFKDILLTAEPATTKYRKAKAADLVKERDAALKESKALNSLEYAKDYIKELVLPYLSSLKGIITGIEDWAKKHGGYMFIPYALKADILSPNKAFYINEIPSVYYTSGNTEASIFPYYDNANIDEDYKNYTLQRLTEIYEKKGRA